GSRLQERGEKYLCNRSIGRPQHRPHRSRTALRVTTHDTPQHTYCIWLRLRPKPGTLAKTKETNTEDQGSETAKQTIMRHTANKTTRESNRNPNFHVVQCAECVDNCTYTHVFTACQRHTHL